MAFLNFSHALEHLKGSRLVTYLGWPIGTYLGIHGGAPSGEAIGEKLAQALKIQTRTIRKVAPYIVIHRPCGIVAPYLPTQEEILGNHWRLIDGEDE